MADKDLQQTDCNGLIYSIPAGTSFRIILKTEKYKNTDYDGKLVKVGE